MEKQGVIYKIENLVNGKVYIGQTVRDPRYRLTNHRNALNGDYHKNAYLQHAYNKYGSANFRFAVIEKVSIDQLDQREIHWISHFRGKQGAYNLEGGGNKNKTIDDSTRKKISVAVRASLTNPVTIERHRRASQLLSGGKHPNARRVICINDGKVFETATEAGKAYGLSLCRVSAVLTGARVSCFSKPAQKYLQFAYFEEGASYELKDNVNAKQPRKVICINTGEIYASTWQAAKSSNISQGTLVMCLNGQRHSAGKDEEGNSLLWEYLDNYDEGEGYKLVKYEGVRNHKSRPVVCLTTGEHFESMRKAEQKYSISPCKVSLACSGKRKHAGQLADGTKLKWRYA